MQRKIGNLQRETIFKKKKLMVVLWPPLNQESLGQHMFKEYHPVIHSLIHQKENKQMQMFKKRARNYMGGHKVRSILGWQEFLKYLFHCLLPSWHPFSLLSTQDPTHQKLDIFQQHKQTKYSKKEMTISNFSTWFTEI